MSPKNQIVWMGAPEGLGSAEEQRLELGEPEAIEPHYKAAREKSFRS
jgi:hypothetical protein